ncbi:MAG: tRNA pseudouridine(38-40) synthase TruA [Halodesulfurarchaeum sp.]
MHAFRVAYDGRPYHGFQRQPDVRTVEGELFGALRELGVEFETKPPGYAAAGRTDAGASALAQTIAFEAPAYLEPRAFTAALPDSIGIWAEAIVPDDFHATHDAVAREYTYHLHAPEASRERAAEAASMLSGRHDFHNLTPDGEGTVRELALTVRDDHPYLVITARAGGFPRQLVRRLVSLLEAVAVGDRRTDFIDRVLRDRPVEGPEGIAPAPAYPLVLTGVRYDVSFQVAEDAAARVSRTFDGLAAERRTAARVADSIAGGLDA